MIFRYQGYTFRYKTVPDATTQTSVSHTVHSVAVQTTPVDLAVVQYMFNQLQPECQPAALSELFSSYMNQLSLPVPDDFLINAANAMVRLSDAGWTKVLSLLIECIAIFFAVDNLQQVYHLWLLLFS